MPAPGRDRDRANRAGHWRSGMFFDWLRSLLSVSHHKTNSSVWGSAAQAVLTGNEKVSAIPCTRWLLMDHYRKWKKQFLVFFIHFCLFYFSLEGFKDMIHLNVTLCRELELLELELKWVPTLNQAMVWNYIWVILGSWSGVINGKNNLIDIFFFVVYSSGAQFESKWESKRL